MNFDLTDDQRAIQDAFARFVDEAVVPRNKDLITGVPRGTVYHQVANGGGGWGDPAKRDRRVRAEEVKNGVITREAALRDYGATPADLDGAA